MVTISDMDEIKRVVYKNNKRWGISFDDISSLVTLGHFYGPANSAPTRDVIQSVLELLVLNGEIYSPREGYYRSTEYMDSDEKWRRRLGKPIKLCSTHNDMLRQGNHLDILFGGYFEQNRCHVYGCVAIAFKTYELKEVK